MLHEVIHELTIYALSDQTIEWPLPKTLKDFRVEMNSIFKDIKDNPLLKNERGVLDVKEFTAELTNPVFRRKLK
ncbi:MAG: hypothetical protein MJZ20_06335 [Bacteroidaceae bacterium]|nr:hypothetical protein [Bacteroidaceae bacterium]